MSERRRAPSNLIRWGRARAYVSRRPDASVPREREGHRLPHHEKRICDGPASRGGRRCDAISSPDGTERSPAGRWRGRAFAAVLVFLASPALADCARDFALGARTHAPFDRELAQRVPNTVILGRIEAGQKRLSAEMRPLATLASILNIWFHHRPVEELFRMLVVNRDTPAIAEALKAIGAERQAGVLDEAMAKFGKRYPGEEERSRRFGPYGEPTDFATSVLALAPAFGTRAEFVEAIAAYACARPGIVAWLEAARARTDLADNFGSMIHEIFTSRQIDGTPEKVEAQLAELPEPYRTLYLVRNADFEVGNGGVHQLFSNSSGNIVGHVPAALRRIGLDTHAELVERGLALFPQPYPTDRAERDRIAFGTIDPRTGMPKDSDEPEATWGAFDDELAKLTEQGWDYNAIEPAALAFARREGVMPQ